MSRCRMPLARSRSFRVSRRLGEGGVGGFRASHFDFCADQEADSGDEADVALTVDVRADVLQVDDADEAAAAEEWHGEECLVGIFGQLVEELEAGIFCGVAGDRYGSAVFRDPAGDALADAEFEAVENFLVRIFGGAQDELFVFLDVNEAGVAFHQGYGELEDALEYFVERVLAGGGDAAAQVVE